MSNKHVDYFFIQVPVDSLSEQGRVKIVALQIYDKDSAV